MKDQKIQNPSFLSVIFLSWFFTGKAPKAPGTIGSLATIPLIYLLHFLEVNIYGLLALITILYILAVVITEHVQKNFDLHDPQWIVIDEVIGMLITLELCDDFGVSSPLFGLRLIQTIRYYQIWPASYFDRLHHGIGTITDDVVSALYAGLVVKMIIHFVP